MNTHTVQALMEDVRLLGSEQYALVEEVRALVKKVVPAISEEVKYGGVLFCSDVQFCGVFAYKSHVSVEFSCGAEIKDNLGYLEGSGKFRRHLKLFSQNDLESKYLASYIDLALEAAKERNGIRNKR